MEILLNIIDSVKDKTLLDVGCGSGELVKELASLGARVTGIDIPDMIDKAKQICRCEKCNYITGTAEALPVEDNYAGAILYMASFHHVPQSLMKQALEETHRVLIPGGTAIFVEPLQGVGESDSYFQLIRLVEDESFIQKHAYDSIKNASRVGLDIISESIVYFERSLGDYEKLLTFFIDNAAKREECLTQARSITEDLCRDSGQSLNDFRFKSICRVNVLRKNKVV